MSQKKKKKSNKKIIPFLVGMGTLLYKITK